MFSEIRRFAGVGVFFLLFPVLVQAELQTAEATLREIPREFRLDGVVEAINKTTVSAQTQGQVEKIFFDVDDYVEQGTVLLQLKDTQQKASLNQAKADLKAAVARSEEAKDEFKRVSEMFDKKLVSQSKMDRSSAALKSSIAAQEAANAGLVQAREQYAYTQVRAPYSGIVTERHVEVGEVASQGTPLMSGISLEHLRVIVAVPQSLIATVREIGKARVMVPGSGTVEAEKLTIFPFADPASNTFKVRVELPQGITNLFPGMFVKAAFETGSKRELVVPAEAIALRSEVTAVYILDETGRVAFRHVRLGHRSEDGMQSVIAGLSDGERVALDPVAAGTLLKQQRAEAAK
jgi:RND family efflux transporter MFP subunit